MVSLTPTFDVEFFNSAYENISLIANKTWAFDEDDPYRKLNEHLWVQNVKYFEKLHGKCVGKHRNIYNVISGLSISQYNNHQYNANSERLCSQNNNLTAAQHNAINSHLNKPTLEPWMLDEVEERFTQLTSNIPLIKKSHYSPLSDDSSQFVNTESEYNKYCLLPYKIDNLAELQLQMRISHENIRHIWNTNELNQSTLLSSSSSSSSLSSSSSSMSSSASSKNDKCEYYCARFQQNDQNKEKYSKTTNRNNDTCHLQHQPIIIARTRYKNRESEGQKRTTTVPSLSAEVPEFFPKCPKINRVLSYDTVPLEHLHLPNEQNYHERIVHLDRRQLSNVRTIYQSSRIPVIATPIMTPLIRPTYHHWIPFIPSPPPQIQTPFSSSTIQHSSTSSQSLCPIIHRPIQLHEKLIMNYSNVNNTAVPIPVYQRPSELYQDQRQRHRSQGVDFNNLILLTKNAMKTRRNQSKISQQSSSFISGSRQPNLKSETDVLQWLNKGYPKRAKEFSTINSLISNIRNYEDTIRDDCDENLRSPNLLELIFNQPGNYYDKNNDLVTGNNDFSINTFR